MSGESATGKVVLAYSGGLDTSVILKWLANQGYEVIAYVADVGQQEDFDRVREKALATGASKVRVEDLRRRTFVTDFIFPAFKANALYEGSYLLGTALARPLIAKRQIEIAHEEEAAHCVSHGATGQGERPGALRARLLRPRPRDQVYISPWKDRDVPRPIQGPARAALLRRGARHPGHAPRAAKPYSEDDNLLHISSRVGDPRGSGVARRGRGDLLPDRLCPEDAPDKAHADRHRFQGRHPRSGSRTSKTAR